MNKCELCVLNMNGFYEWSSSRLNDKKFIRSRCEGLGIDVVRESESFLLKIMHKSEQNNNNFNFPVYPILPSKSILNPLKPLAFK